jgi:hypothetical protein
MTGNSMTFLCKSVLLAGLTLGLGACASASSLLNGKSSVPQASNIQVGNQLAMPPDLQLPQPGQGADNYQPDQVVETANTSDSADVMQKKPAKKTAMASTTAPIERPPDIFDQNNISKVNEDGTPKSADKLREELRLALLLKKKQANPRYGTIANIGNIFKDQ